VRDREALFKRILAAVLVAPDLPSATGRSVHGMVVITTKLMMKMILRKSGETEKGRQKGEN
jgi:hypothetical protein